MVRVTIKDNQLNVKGHALYDDYGKDIVCAGISTIMIGGLNALYLFGANEDSIMIQDADIKVNFENYPDKLRHVIETMIVQLETIEEQYPEYIKIKNGGV